MRRVAVGAILLCWSGAAAADIIEWRDADGVSHYTNLVSTIPKEQEGATRIVVDEVARQRAASSAPAVAEDAVQQAPEPPRKVEVVNDPVEVTDAYVRGLLRGLDAVSNSNTGGGGGAVQISGPLAVVNTAAPQPSYDYVSPWLYPGGYYPLGGYAPGFYPYGFVPVVASFQNERSHHGQRHTRVHDRLAFDGSTPIFFNTRVIPPAGPPPLGIGPNLLSPRTGGGAIRGSSVSGTLR